MFDSYVERFKVNTSNVQRFKVNVERFKVNVQRFKVTHPA